MSSNSTPTLSYLKGIKNGIIGNPSKKLEIARDGSIPSFVSFHSIVRRIASQIVVVGLTKPGL